MGYHYPAPVVRYDGPEGTPLEGLWIEVRQVRTGEEIRALMANGLQIDLNQVMRPYVVGWNYEGLRQVEVTAPATDILEERTTYVLEQAPLPVPADHEEDVLRLVDRDVLAWIRSCLLASVSWKPGGDDPKDSNSPLANTPSGESSAPSTENPSPDPVAETNGKRRRRVPVS